MIHAIGWSSDPFLPHEPGRLCRGRERWIESFQLPDPPELHRVVISGACFTDDSARDAERGLFRSGIHVHDTIFALYGEKVIVAWCEEGHPLKVPEDAVGVEEYDLRRPGGPLWRWTARWARICETAEQLEAALDAGADVVTVHSDRDQVVDEEGEPRDALRDAVFLLTGSRHHGHPLRRFQPGAIPVTLEQCEALLLIHQDKHAPCIGLYTTDPVDVDDELADLAEDNDVLPVPFAIPPMLARWDRALWELRQDWDEDEQGEFPVPPAPEGSWGWGRRRKKKKSRRKGGSDEE